MLGHDCGGQAWLDALRTRIVVSVAEEQPLSAVGVAIELEASSSSHERNRMLMGMALEFGASDR